MNQPGFEIDEMIMWYKLDLEITFTHIIQLEYQIKVNSQPEPLYQFQTPG